MEAFIPLIVSALGGVIAVPVLSRLLGGSGEMGLIGGILGGVGAHYGADFAGAGQILGTTPMLSHLQNFLEGIAGGGILGLLAGAFSKAR